MRGQTSPVSFRAPGANPYCASRRCKFVRARPGPQFRPRAETESPLERRPPGSSAVGPVPLNAQGARRVFWGAEPRRGARGRTVQRAEEGARRVGEGGGRGGSGSAGWRCERRAPGAGAGAGASARRGARVGGARARLARERAAAVGARSGAACDWPRGARARAGWSASRRREALGRSPGGHPRSPARGLFPGEFGLCDPRLGQGCGRAPWQPVASPGTSVSGVAFGVCRRRLGLGWVSDRQRWPLFLVAGLSALPTLPCRHPGCVDLSLRATLLHIARSASWKLGKTRNPRDRRRAGGLT